MVTKKPYHQNNNKPPQSLLVYLKNSLKYQDKCTHQLPSNKTHQG